GVAWERDARLVRGLDYYRHTAFEFVTDRLGAQGTVLGGGRYDGLIEALGGPATPAVGWAAGIERLGMLLASSPVPVDLIAVIPADSSCEDDAAIALRLLRNAGLACSIAFRGNVKRRVEIAKKEGATVRLLIRHSSDPMGRLHISHFESEKTNKQQDELDRRISNVLLDYFGTEFSSSGPNRPGNA
ncbi:MAG: ATP phosphoribosyltransferase regulatory subunit, partial [Chakrabartia sp.]